MAARVIWMTKSRSKIAMTPEIKVFVFAGAMIAFAYTVLYPRMRTKSLNRMMLLDIAISAAIILLVGIVYYGTGTRFSLVLFDVPWWAFALLSAAIVEVPFFIWFCKRWNIDFGPPKD